MELLYISLSNWLRQTVNSAYKLLDEFLNSQSYYGVFAIMDIALDDDVSFHVHQFVVWLRVQ